MDPVVDSVSPRKKKQCDGEHLPCNSTSDQQMAEASQEPSLALPNCLEKFCLEICED